MPIAGICLAAGFGSRMGMPKPAVELAAGLAVGAIVVRALAAAGCRPVYVVVRPDDDLRWLPEGWAGLGVVPVVNPDPAAGMSGSIRCGVRAAMAADPKPDAALIAMADQPFLTAGKLREWGAAFRRDPQPAYVAGAWNGDVRPPVLWASETFERLLRLEGDAGGKALIAGAAADCRGARVPMTEAEAADLDTPVQLEEARALWRKISAVADHRRTTQIPTV